MSSATLWQSFQRLSGNPRKVVERHMHADTASAGAVRSLGAQAGPRGGWGACMRLPRVPWGLNRDSKGDYPLKEVPSAPGVHASIPSPTVGSAVRRGTCLPVLSRARRPPIAAKHVGPLATAEAEGSRLESGNSLQLQQQHSELARSSVQEMPPAGVGQTTTAGATTAAITTVENRQMVVPCGPGQLGSQQATFATHAQLDIQPDGCKQTAADVQKGEAGTCKVEQWDVTDGGEVFMKLLEQLARASLVEVTETSAFSAQEAPIATKGADGAPRTCAPAVYSREVAQSSSSVLYPRKIVSSSSTVLDCCCCS